MIEPIGLPFGGGLRFLPQQPGVLRPPVNPGSPLPVPFPRFTPPTAIGGLGVLGGGGSFGSLPMLPPRLFSPGPVGRPWFGAMGRPRPRLFSGPF